jgi:HEAT repeats/PBS lyase HEAT-like repeat
MDGLSQRLRNSDIEVKRVPRDQGLDCLEIECDRFVRGWQVQTCLLFSIFFALFGSVGCVDGPLFALKRMNPYYQSKWREDSKRGVVFAERRDEMKRVREQIATMSADEQARWSKVVAKVYDEDTSPELRRDAVLALGESPHPEAESALIRACSDKNDKVRIAACKAMAGRNSENAGKMLSTIAQTDKNMSVRLAAVRSLGTYETDDAKTLLRKALDEKSPAIQYEATVALKKMTGRDFNGDVESWKKFMDGQTIEEPTKTLAENISDTLGIRR